MRQVLLFAVLILIGSFVTAQEEESKNWKIAEEGFLAFEEANYKGALKKLEEATKYVEEFSDENKAKVYFHFAKSLENTSNLENFQEKVKLYKAYHEAAKYGSGQYKQESEIHLDDFKTVVEKGYYEEVDKVETGELSKEEVELVIWAAELFGYNEDAQQFRAYMDNME